MGQDPREIGVFLDDGTASAHISYNVLNRVGPQLMLIATQLTHINLRRTYT